MKPLDAEARGRLHAVAREAIREGWLPHELDPVRSEARRLGVRLTKERAARIMAHAARTTARA